MHVTNFGAQYSFLGFNLIKAGENNLSMHYIPYLILFSSDFFFLLLVGEGRFMNLTSLLCAEDLNS
jgi:hypothetical protein